MQISLLWQFLRTGAFCAPVILDRVHAVGTEGIADRLADQARAIAAAGRRANHLRYKQGKDRAGVRTPVLSATAWKAGYKRHGGEERASSQKLP